MTPHPIVIIDIGCTEYDSRTRSYRIKTGESVKILREIPSETGGIPRCTSSEEDCAPVDGVPTISVKFGEIENLPDYTEGTFLIVSAIVANAARECGRQDVLVPSRIVRDSEGKIFGCLALARQS